MPSRHKPSSAAAHKPPFASDQATLERNGDISTLDALFAHAGLVRSLRGKSGALNRSRVDRLERSAPEELLRSATEPRIASNGVRFLAVSGMERIPWLWHGFSTRQGGVSRAYCAEDVPGELNLGFTPVDRREAVVENRKLMAEAISGDRETPLITLRQIHSNLVHVVSASDAGRERPWKADGVITGQPGLLIGIQTADCIPVLVADRKRRVVAAFHAGWRGTVKRIVETGIGRMRIEFGSRPEDLSAAIGPGAGPCCYAVGEEVLSEFDAQFVYSRELFHEVYSADAVHNKYPMLFLTQCAPGHSPIGPGLHLDLVEANRRQLLDAGLSPRSIHLTGGCTNCQADLFFSHRASRGYAGRMIAAIGIKPR
jgi:YfiH family protein